MIQVKKWLSIGQAAKYLGISRDTLRRWEKRGKIKTVRSPSNRRYYTKEQLDLVMSGENTSKDSKKPAKKSTLSRKKIILISLVSFLVAILISFLCILFLTG